MLVCDGCKEKVYYLFAREVEGRRKLLCWDCIIKFKAKKEGKNGTKSG